MEVRGLKSKVPKPSLLKDLNGLADTPESSPDKMSDDLDNYEDSSPECEQKKLKPH